MEEIVKSLNEPINQLITLGVVLAFYVLCYSVRLAGGKRRTKKQKIAWSWERFWNDLHFRLCIGYALIAGVIAVDMAQWLMPLLGLTIKGETAAMLNANLIITIPFVAGLAELLAGMKLLYKVWRYKENLSVLGITEQDIDSNKADIAQIAGDTKEFIAKLLAGINVQQDSTEVESGTVLTKAQTKKLAEMGSIPYYKLDISTPQKAYQNLIGKGFNEGWGFQCVAGFKEFMFCLAGRYVAAGGAASGYALGSVIKTVCTLGFTWHAGSDGLQDGDWGIWTSGLYGHVSMYYQGKWLGQNQGAADGNVGNAFNLMTLPMEGFAGYFRPNIYAKATSKPKTEVKTPAAKPVAPKPSADVVKYTYKQGDTFGQVLLDLGLSTPGRLWVAGGDVEYYTAQLRAQGITGNIPVGREITLTRRK